MHAIPLAIPDVFLVTPKVFGDERGFFYESFNARVFTEVTGQQPHFVQDNHSSSVRGVLRGLHYQLPPHAQGKLVRVVQGEVFDVAVDIRRGSPTFGKWVGALLSSQNRKQLWIPPGFAHGFVTLSETAEFVYKTTDFYSAQSERCIAWDDPQIAIEWPIDFEPRLSPKDQLGKALGQADLFG
ncbi:dTDP-4-dehydrorhamnose 3,5-epimerase [Pseudomonas shirazica]|uniref:dTDP-4-dehydrorhamnose 3,5-epimerase n=1 Tax=Pseudomonas asiatica TaxID=2219225 RepID=UPI0015FD5FEF|nr:dTDP-4-dehydrorhamnose 3,5-epimerase [Pseudomonas asiatica]MBA6109347.1 dTDP-4-dehydrorhamnose 3,5-epimerase [Pseudomonas asiatica]UQB76805.1 dTDP-4-dehydrorhamnose 3,5-epimerase [Pseudomonas shirazica]